MHFAPIAPVKYLGQLDNSPVVMALTHLCDNEEYVAYYKKKSDNGAFVMLDNSIIELGHAVSVEELLAAAEKIGAHEIIIPDSFKDAEGTLVLAEKYYTEVRKKFEGRIMAVAHGNSALEWANCAKTLIKMGVDTIGVPKVMTSIIGPHGRFECMKQLKKMKGITSAVEFHFLGIWSDILEVSFYEHRYEENNLPAIRSCDSILSFDYAKSYMHFEDGARPKNSIDFLDDSYEPTIAVIHAQNIAECYKHVRDPFAFLEENRYTPKNSKVKCPPITEGKVTHAVFGQDK